MIPASVGFQCPECVQVGQQGRPDRPRTVFGGRVTDDPGWVSKVLIGDQRGGLRAAAGLRRVHRAVPATSARCRLDPIGDDGRRGRRRRVLPAAHGRLPARRHRAPAAEHVRASTCSARRSRPRSAGCGSSCCTSSSALGGSALSYAFAAPAQPSLGASGAVFGLLGAYLVVNRRLGRDNTPVHRAAGDQPRLRLPGPPASTGGRTSAGWSPAALVAAAFAYAPAQRRGRCRPPASRVVLLVVVAVVAWRTADLRGG